MKKTMKTTTILMFGDEENRSGKRKGQRSSYMCHFRFVSKYLIWMRKSCEPCITTVWRVFVAVVAVVRLVNVHLSNAYVYIFLFSMYKMFSMFVWIDSSTSTETVMQRLAKKALLKYEFFQKQSFLFLFLCCYFDVYK